MNDDGPRVWWFYGPPCAGKSATAWAVHTQELIGVPRGCFDVDQVGMCYPEPDGDPERSELKARASLVVIKHFVEAGARRVVVSGVIEPEGMRTVGSGGVPVTFCRVRVEPAELRRRLTARYDPDDVERALVEADALERGVNPLHVVVDGAEGTPAEVARRAVELLTARPDLGRATESGRALLICGPAGVGKSTVGFDVFLRLTARERSVYLDLRQLGFLTDVPGAGLDVTAGLVAELWATYRGVGARNLVLTGRLDDPGDVERYREALGDTPLEVVRLTAGEEVLRERLSRLARGDGPNLIGEVPVLADALVQAGLEGVATDGLTAAATADLVLRRFVG